MRHLIIACAGCILFLSTGCKKNCTPIVTSPCIVNTIETNKNNAKWQYKAVEEYEYQGAAVYIFIPVEITADMQTIIVSADCNLLCHLGGITGKLDCNGEIFYQKAIFKRKVWER